MRLNWELLGISLYKNNKTSFSQLTEENRKVAQTTWYHPKIQFSLICLHKDNLAVISPNGSHNGSSRPDTIILSQKSPCVGFGSTRQFCIAGLWLRGALGASPLSLIVLVETLMPNQQELAGRYKPAKQTCSLQWYPAGERQTNMITINLAVCLVAGCFSCIYRCDNFHAYLCVLVPTPWCPFCSSLVCVFPSSLFNKCVFVTLVAKDSFSLLSTETCLKEVRREGAHLNFARMERIEIFYL